MRNECDKYFISEKFIGVKANEIRWFGWRGKNQYRHRWCVVIAESSRSEFPYEKSARHSFVLDLSELGLNYRPVSSVDHIIRFPDPVGISAFWLSGHQAARLHRRPVRPGSPSPAGTADRTVVRPGSHERQGLGGRAREAIPPQAVRSGSCLLTLPYEWPIDSRPLTSLSRSPSHALIRSVFLCLNPWSLSYVLVEYYTDCSRRCRRHRRRRHSAPSSTKTLLYA